MFEGSEEVINPVVSLLFMELVTHNINSPHPSDAYVRQWNGSALVQIMACRLVVAKPLSEPVLKYW